MADDGRLIAEGKSWRRTVRARAKKRIPSPPITPDKHGNLGNPGNQPTPEPTDLLPNHKQRI